MDCALSDEQLWSWVDRDAPELAAHLASCPRCRRLAGELRREVAHLGQVAAPPPRLAPESVGAYRVVRRIGEGGQGLVYEAEQDAPRRRVALKVLRAGDGRVRDVRQFEREIAALARLRHVGIASIHESGYTAEGQPFFTMDLVDGRPLNVYVREEHLPLRERLALFGRLCAPVIYAHQQGIIHRDLKPSNILVDRSGEPHVLDFGLARATDVDATRTASLHETGQILGTLPYLSPEQAAGRAAEADVRSDVYSLGVLLYELLTDQVPHPAAQRLPHDILRAIREEPPPRPSSINRQLRGDLETIVLKALEKEPQRRYATAAALADDVQRYLDGEPIAARPASTVYQVRKLVARHKLPCALAAALVAAVGLLGVSSTVLAARLARERDRAVLAGQRETIAAAEAGRQAAAARAAAERAERTRAFLEELLFSSDPRWTQGERTIRDVLAEAERRLAEGWSDQPELEADLRLLLGRTYLKFGMAARGLPQLRTALDIRTQRYGPDDPAVAEICAELSRAMYGESQRAEGLALLERARRIRAAALGPEHPLTLETQAELGRLRYFAGDLAESAALLSQVLAARRAAGPSAELAAALHDLAPVRAAQGEREAALALGHEAVALDCQRAGEPSVAAAKSRYRLAELYAKLRDFEAAETQYQALRALFNELPGQAANEVLVLMRLAALHQAQADAPGALSYSEQALALAQAAFPDWHYIGLCAHLELGRALARDGQYAAAEPHLLHSLAGYADLYGPEHGNVRVICRALADLYRDWGQPQRAAEFRARAEPPPAADLASTAGGEGAP